MRGMDRRSRRNGLGRRLLRIGFGGGGGEVAGGCADVVVVVGEEVGADCGAY